MGTAVTLYSPLPTPDSQFKDEETQLTICKAKLIDVPDIHRLINHYAAERIMLPRTLTDLYENVWEFTVVAEEQGKLLGCGALKLYNQEVAEIRSLCVDESLKSKGIGREVMEELLDEADAFGQERVLDLDLLEPDRSRLAGDLGELRDLVDQLTLGRLPHRERKFGAERETVKDRDQRKPDQGGGEGAAENDDEGMIGKVHSEVAAHEDDRRNDHRSAKETEACRDVHGEVSETHYARRPLAALPAT